MHSALVPDRTLVTVTCQDSTLLIPTMFQSRFHPWRPRPPKLARKTHDLNSRSASEGNAHTPSLSPIHVGGPLSSNLTLELCILHSTGSCEAMDMIVYPSTTVHTNG